MMIVYDATGYGRTNSTQAIRDTGYYRKMLRTQVKCTWKDLNQTKVLSPFPTTEIVSGKKLHLHHLFKIMRTN